MYKQNDFKKDFQIFIALNLKLDVAKSKGY